MTPQPQQAQVGEGFSAQGGCASGATPSRSGAGYRCSLCRDTGFRPAETNTAGGFSRGVIPCDCRRIRVVDSVRAFESRDTVAALIRTGRSRKGLALSLEERKVVAALRDALGQARAVPLAEIARLTGLNDRAIKGVIESLRNLHQLDVGACRGYQRKVGGPQESKLVGYYWITRPEELLETIRPYYRQALTTLKTVNVMTHGRKGLKRILAEQFGQVPLFQEEP